MGILEELASAVSFPSVDWEALSQKFGMPPKDVVYKEAFSYQREYLDPVFDRVLAKLENIKLTWDLGRAATKADIAFAVDAWHRVREDTLDVSDAVLSALQHNIDSIMGSEDELRVGKEDFRALISSIWMSTMYGVLAHRKGLYQLDLVSSQDIMANADRLMQTCGALEFLYDSGALDSLRKATAVQSEAIQPTGALPAVAVVVIAVSSALAIAAIAYVVLSWQQIAAVNKQMAMFCDEGLKQGDTDLLDRCERLAKANQISVQDPLKGVGSSIGTWLVVGFGTYLLFLSAPTLVEMASKKAAR